MIVVIPLWNSMNFIIVLMIMALKQLNFNNFGGCPNGLKQLQVEDFKVFHFGLFFHRGRKRGQWPDLWPAWPENAENNRKIKKTTRNTQAHHARAVVFNIHNWCQTMEHPTPSTRVPNWDFTAVTLDVPALGGEEPLLH